MEEIKLNQQSKPLANYNNTIDDFPMKYYYSGYLFNMGTNSLSVNFNLWTGELLPSLIIPNNDVIYIEDLPIKEISISAGYYTYSFIGTYYEGFKPKYKIDLKIGQMVIVNSYSSSVNLNYGSGNVIELEVKTSSTANTVTQLTTDNTLIMGAITLLADLNNTNPILIGNQSSPNFPLNAGASLSLFYVRPSNIYIKSAGTSQLLHVIYNE